jgi:hypothetical protein
MPMTLWEIGGHLIQNAGGTALLECDTCPCEVLCSRCAPGTSPTVLRLSIFTDLNLFGSCVDCASLVAAWNMPVLTSGEISTLYATYPYAFTPDPDTGLLATGCYFALLTGLPCDCRAMIAEIIDAGAGGTATVKVSFCWDTEFVTLVLSINTAGIDADCIVNLSQPITSVTIIASASPPCDFLRAYDPTLLALTAIP